MESALKGKIKEAVRALYNGEVSDDLIQVQETRKDFKGDFTLIVFPFTAFSKILLKRPERLSGNGFLNHFRLFRALMS